jgi:ABC-type multidrug transport system fused ATPase/permease subunit
MGGIILVALLMMARSGYNLINFLPTLTVYAFGAYKLMPLLQAVYRGINNMKYNTLIVQKLNTAFHDLPAGIPLPDDNLPKLPFKQKIEMRDISFAYPNTEKDVIKHLNLHIQSNTSIALVGYTGCGKTTTVDILLGLLEPSQGRILVDDVEITDSNVKNWQRNMGYVPQSIYLTDDSIKNNIAFGYKPEDIDDEAVIRAAKLANLHGFVSSELPEGYDTKIGERGVRLSGGQRQRIGIARAVYNDPSVLILDEATSALDGLTEAAIMDAIEIMGGKKTIIMIAHRITTVKKCDIIYMMNHGVITDSGNYNELYEHNEHFRKMAGG